VNSFTVSNTASSSTSNVTYTFRAPDPEATGSIRHIVETAHRWGGDGRKPLFRKIRQVLMRKHPEVIAKAFGGNANVAAAWIKNNWYRLRGSEPPPTRGRRHVSASLSLDRYQEVPLDFFNEGDELFLAAGVSKQDRLVYVNALRTGEWKVNPVVGAKGPLVIDKGFMEEVLKAWKEGAWEYVTVPTYHTDHDPLANTGYVRDLTIKPDPKRQGEWVLRAGIEFTDPVAEQKVMQGSIAGVSVNVKSNVKHQETGKTFKRVLTHLCLTNIPFINGLDAFSERLAADRLDDLEGVTLSYQLDDTVGDDDFEGSFVDELMSLAKAAFNEEHDFNYVRRQIEAQLMRGYYLDADGDLVHPDGGDHTGLLSPAYVYVMGMTPDQVLVCAHSSSDGEVPSSVGEMNGYMHGWVLSYDVSNEGEVTLDPLDEWLPVEKKWVPSDGDVSASVPISGENQIEVNDVAFTLVKRDETETESPRGGDVMPEPTKPESEEKPKEEPKIDAALTLTREQAEELAAAKVEEALTAYRQEQEAAAQAHEAQLSAMRQELHERTVKEKVADLVAKGHAPAVIELAREFMLADTKGETVLSLTREDKEMSLSVTEVVSEILDAIPPTALSQTEVEVPTTSRKPEDSKSHADAVYEELFGPNAAPAASLS